MFMAFLALQAMLLFVSGSNIFITNPEAFEFGFSHF